MLTREKKSHTQPKKLMERLRRKFTTHESENEIDKETLRDEPNFYSAYHCPYYHGYTVKMRK